MSSLNNSYTGYVVVYDYDEILPNLYCDKNTNWFNLLENQYLVVKDASNNVVDKYKWQDGKHKNVYKKPLESMALGKVKPKNIEQELAIDSLLDDTTTIKLFTGTFGSGKDYLQSAVAFQMLQEGKFDKILWLRNNIEVKDSNPIGHLPGSKLEKLQSFAAPIADILGGWDMLNMYIQQEKIEIEHLGLIRGRNFKNTIVYCSEAENLTTKNVQLILGRIGEGSILFMNGDWRQIDAKAFEKDNGLIKAIDKLKGNRLFSYVHLKETVRSETAKLADLLD